ncbi:MAG: iron-containing alcohol dehydrogenase [Bacteriovoracaceae bacterium]|nr:iron-containing alcohol dehydrogenase [Bacteriovoracaceae bacterium]
MIQATTLNWPNLIEFGAGKIKTLKDHLENSKRAFILVDPPIKPMVESLLNEISRTGVEFKISTEVIPEPPINEIKKFFKPVNEFAPDTVVGIGGGSAMDMAKIIAVLFDGKQSVEDVIGIGNVSNRDVKLITSSTTSGTGSEVTPIAVLTDTDAKLKKGIVSPFLVPDVAIIDPELSMTLPAPITAATGMDAMTHCIEAYTNKHAHPIIDNLAIEGIRLIASSLERACNNGNDLEARTALALGSLYGGMCLGPVNTAAVHALAYPLGGEFKISHGVANSVLLPFVMQFNYISSAKKYANVAKACGVKDTGDVEQMASLAVKKVREISNSCKIPSSIKELGIPENAITEMAKAAMKVTRLLDNNPREITLSDAGEIYRNAYDGVIK